MTTAIARVRVVGGDGDPAVARLRLTAALAPADLRPPGLAPAALLLVRRVDGLPRGGLSLGAHARPSAAWASAFVSALERALREAARPAHGAVPAGAEAVLFADRAELLACLARDSLDGTAATRWWWRSVLARAAGASAGTVHAWSDAPEHVPAALEQLARWSLAPAFARLLPGSVARELAARVARAFAMPEVGALAATPSAQPPLHPGARATTPSTPPWSELVPEAAEPALDVGRQLLLGLALALRRAPTLARTLAFAQALRAWERALEAAGARVETGATELGRRGSTPTAPPFATAPQRESRAAAPVARDGSPESVGQRRGAAARPPRDPSPKQRPAVGAPTAPVAPATHGPAGLEGSRLVGDARASAEPAQSASPAGSGEPPAPPAPATAPAAAAAPRSPHAPPPLAPPPRPPARGGPAPARQLAPAPVMPAARRDSLPARPADDAPAHDLLAERPVDTGLGGLFYLLSLALQLDLYGDFTRPRDPGIALSPWDLVELLGLRLLGERPDDPVWELLASLAARPPGAPPGHGHRTPPAWRVPSAWLAPLDHDGTWRWSAAAGVLRVMHPAGFAAIAVPRTAAPPATQLHGELERLASAARRSAPAGPDGSAGAGVRDALARLASPAGAPVRTSLPREPTSPLGRWMARLSGYAEARLRRVLALEDGETVDETLIRRRARIFASTTHVDVVLKLAELPIHVRIAGLDRTPGWIPATGRFVAFHFE